MLAYLLLSTFPACLIVAAANDIYEFKIPNWISIILLVVYPIAGLAVGATFFQMAEGLLLGAGMLVIGFALFAGGIVGGGDAKLLAAVSPWLGLTALGGFLVNTAISGAVLAVFLMAFRSFPLLPVYAQASWLIRLHERKNALPYGVAIAGGGVLSFSHTLFFKLAFGG